VFHPYLIVLKGDLCEFYLHLIGCHISIFYDMEVFLRREKIRVSLLGF
jgi:hypothetical protein